MLMLKVKYRSLEVLVAELLVLLALLEHVHVVLAHADLVGGRFQAGHEVHVVGSARVLHLLLLSVLLLLWFGVLLLALHLLLLLAFSLSLTLTSVAGATSHKTLNSHVSHS